MSKRADKYVVVVDGKKLGVVHAKSEFAAKTQATTRYKLTQDQLRSLVLDKNVVEDTSVKVLR